jgi:rhomboid protease GluP
VTACFLHSGAAHLLGNGIAIFFAGLLLERMIGGWWFIVFFVLGGISSSFVSLAAHPGPYIGVGASGGIMALFAALFVTSFHLPKGHQRHRVQLESLRILVPALLPAAANMHIDIPAHLGGAVAGVVMALLLIGFWPRGTDEAPGRQISLVLGCCACFLVLFCASAAQARYPVYAKRFDIMIPEKEIPPMPDARRQKSAWLLQHYPKDPRAHAFRGDALLQDHNIIGARLEFEDALKLTEADPLMFGRKFANAIRVTLAMMWLADHAQGEAEKIAQPVCLSPSSDRPDSYVVLVQHHLCP